jgi:hypothetical protein
MRRQLIQGFRIAAIIGAVLVAILLALPAQAQYTNQPVMYNPNDSNWFAYGWATNTPYRWYRGDTNNIYGPTEYVTSDRLDFRLQQYSAQILYGTTNSHPVLTGCGSLDSIEGAAWSTNMALAAGTNYLGCFIATQMLNTAASESDMFVPAGEYLGHYHVKVTGLGNPVIEAFWKLAAISTNGSITNIIDTTSLKDITDATTETEYDSRAHTSTNYLVKTNSYLAVLWYGKRTGGASGSITTYGGGGKSTSIRTPSIFYQTPAVGSTSTNGLAGVDSVIAATNSVIDWTKTNAYYYVQRTINNGFAYDFELTNGLLTGAWLPLDTSSNGVGVPSKCRMVDLFVQSYDNTVGNSMSVLPTNTSSPSQVRGEQDILVSGQSVFSASGCYPSTNGIIGYYIGSGMDGARIKVKGWWVAP